MLTSLLFPIIVAVITTVVIGSLLDKFVKPYIEVRKNKITAKEENIINLITLLKIVVGNLRVVYKEASNGKTSLLNPTEVQILSTRLARIEDDTRNIIRMLTVIEVCGQKIKAKHDYVEQLARITGGAIRIKSNVEKNNKNTIKGAYGLRRVNKNKLDIYMDILNDLLNDLDELQTQKKSLLQRIFA